MNGLLSAVLTVAACGTALALLETLLPKSAIRSTARVAIGLIFLDVLIRQIGSMIP